MLCLVCSQSFFIATPHSNQLYFHTSVEVYFSFLKFFLPLALFCLSDIVALSHKSLLFIFKDTAMPYYFIFTTFYWFGFNDSNFFLQPCLDLRVSLPPVNDSYFRDVVFSIEDSVGAVVGAIVLRREGHYTLVILLMLTLCQYRSILNLLTGANTPTVSFNIGSVQPHNISLTVRCWNNDELLLFIIVSRTAWNNAGIREQAPWK